MTTTALFLIPRLTIISAILNHGESKEIYLLFYRHLISFGRLQESLCKSVITVFLYDHNLTVIAS